MKEKTKIKYLYFTILLMSLFMSLFSVWLFGVANHNVDLGQNLMKINEITGQNFIDINSLNEIWSGSDMYIEGGKQLNRAYLILGIALFFFGFSLKGVMENGYR